jgi:uncharacterized repeat protein (TIGR03803 family)
MRTLHRYLRPALIVTAALLAAGPASAQVVTVIHSFSGGATDGAGPGTSLLLSGSTLYGMTYSGGAAGQGTIFSLGTGGTGFNVMYSFAGPFTDGGDPSGTLVQFGSTLYGLTEAGASANAGSAFQIGVGGGGYGLIHQFTGGATDGASPMGTPVLSGSALYGFTTNGGGANLGTVFSMTASGGAFTVLHSFAGGAADGQYPFYGAPALSGSTLYGMTNLGGTSNAGTVFDVHTDGTGFTVLHSFGGSINGDGGVPQGQPIVSGTTLFGMTANGGGANHGMIYRMNTDGSGYTLLHEFGLTSGDGRGALGELLLSGSTLFGMTLLGGTANLGTIFEIETDGSGYTELHSFVGGAGDGAGPTGDLILSGSTLYGMTGAGGATDNGVVFSFPVAVPEPSTLLLTTAAAGTIAYPARRRRCKT